MHKILIADKMHPLILDMLKGNFELIYEPDITRDLIKDRIEGCYGMVIRSKTFVDAELLDKAQDLRFIGRAGAGMDNIDQNCTDSIGIELLNAPEGNRDALGEHVVGMLLTLFNHINIADLEVRSKAWRREPNRGFELKGRTVGIFGYGYMGSATAEKLSGFGCRVLAFDKLKNYDPQFAQEVEWEVFQSEVEILSIHVPLTNETSRMFDRKRLEAFPKLKFVINTARGEILVLNDLTELLEEGKIKGACLDVLENEKMKTWTPENHSVFDRLKEMNNVILTPHVGGWTFESYERISEVLANKILALQLDN